MTDKAILGAWTGDAKVTWDDIDLKTGDRVPTSIIFPVVTESNIPLISAVFIRKPPSGGYNPYGYVGNRGVSFSTELFGTYETIFSFSTTVDGIYQQSTPGLVGASVYYPDDLKQLSGKQLYVSCSDGPVRGRIILTYPANLTRG